MIKIFLFFFVALAWPLLTIFVLQIQNSLTKPEYITNFFIYSVVGIISSAFLVYFIYSARSLYHKIYIYSGYIIVIPWVYIFFYYLNFWLQPVVLCLVSSFIPVIGAFIGSKLGKNV